MNLDMKGICVSGGSACSSGADMGSHVIRAVAPGVDRVPIRFSFCKHNTQEEIDLVIEKIKEAPKKVGGLELTEDQNKDVRYLKGKVISAGNLVEGLSENDIVHYDKVAGHGIEWKDKLYYVLKLGDIVLVE